MHRETNCLRPKPSIQFTVFKIFCLPWQRCTWRHRCRDVTFVRCDLVNLLLFCLFYLSAWRRINWRQHDRVVWTIVCALNIVRILFINTFNEDQTHPVRHRAIVSCADTDDRVVLTHCVTDVHSANNATAREVWFYLEKNSLTQVLRCKNL